MKKNILSSINLKQRIYLSFSLLVLLFVINAAVSIITLYQNNRLSKNIATVIEPSLKEFEDLKDVIMESKMYITNWVFLDSGEEDKKLLLVLHNEKYPSLKANLVNLLAKWENTPVADSLNQILGGFEKLLLTQKQVMQLLQKPGDYNDPGSKLTAKKMVKEQVLPQTAIINTALNKLLARQQFYKAEKNRLLKQSSSRLTILISVLALLITGLGIFLSFYMSKIIISPVNKIKHILNDLGKGITRKVDQKITDDEIGSMVVSLNSLSERLQATAKFAGEIGKRNFDTHFEALSDEDTLGKALLAMRDNIRLSDNNLNEAQHLAHVGNWERIISTNEMNVSDEMLNIFGIYERPFNFSYDVMLKFIHAEDLEMVKDRNVRNLYTVPAPYECRIITANGLTKIIYVETKVVLDETGIPVKSFGIIQDITKRKMDEELLRRSENSLERKNQELLTKNKELEQFAYVASHDLQEPLKTTSSFVNLLHRRYKGKLDEQADQYLNYISKASERMQTLIKDLLDYSLIGSKEKVEHIDCNKILEDVTASLQNCIKNTHAVIRYSPLPVINGYNEEIKDLFLHLMSNALKFKKPDVTPLIRIGAMNLDEHWQFFVQDNGIGIDEQYMERIFVIFQRLHNRSEYEGSSIGLSHCRKIVELHNGKIWLESSIGKGTTFYFTISKNLGAQAAQTGSEQQASKKMI